MTRIALYLYILGAIYLFCKCREEGGSVALSLCVGMAWPLIYTWVVVEATLDSLGR